ncbi:MAG TPA: hypothetical protein VNG12_11285 [Acidimicrobiales bacterium]|nr:hypothetical protein [Acidimicrobiales bacterium]
MASGLVASLIVIAVGAILDFAVTVSPNQHGFNLNTVGVILLIVGVIGAIASLAFFGWGSGGIRRHRTMIDDGNGNVVRREDTYQ